MPWLGTKCNNRERCRGVIEVSINKFAASTINLESVFQTFTKFFKGHLVVFFLICVIILSVFGQLTKTFYQQDEWNGLGLVLSEGLESAIPGTFRPMDILFVKGRILSSLIFYLFAVNFPLQNIQLAIFAITLHITATFLVFLLIKKFIRSLLFSLLGTIFFAVNAVSHGAVTWSVIAISVVGSSIFVFTAIHFFFKFLENSRSKFLFLSGLMFYFSLWFKETGLYLFIFFPLVALLYRSYKARIYLSHFWWFFVLFFLFVGYRILELKLGTPDPNLYISSRSENFFLTIFVRMIIYPLTSFSLMFVPGEYFLEFAREVLRDNYSFFSNAPNNILIAQSAVLDLLAVILTFVLILLFSVFLQKEKLGDRKIAIFWLAFSFASFLPYVVLSKDFSYLESRYYYLPVAGGAFLLAWLSGRIREAFGKIFFFGLVLPLYMLYIFLHAKVVYGAIGEQVALSGLRHNFIGQLKEFAPSVNNKKNVFYITSDQNYWADGNKIPFQQGSGYTLMVLYYDSGKIPKEFLKEGFLFDIGSQGYKESGELGFGYFWDKEELENAVRLYNLPPKSIIGLKYDSQTKKLIPTKNE